MTKLTVNTRNCTRTLYKAINVADQKADQSQSTLTDINVANDGMLSWIYLTVAIIEKMMLVDSNSRAR